MRIYRGFLVVAQGQFGGALAHQNFVLDTGTSPSIVNSRAAKELGLATKSWAMTTVGKTVPTQSAVLAELEFGPIRASSLRVQVHDLSRLERDIGIPVAGIIGLDVLSKCSFRLDYDRMRIDFGEVSDEGIPVSFDEHTGIAVARAALDGRPARMLVDTGSDRVALLGNDLEEARFALHGTSQRGWALTDANIEVQVLLAPDISLGGQHFALKRAYFIRGGTDPAFDGFLGVRALGFRAVAYDRVRSMLYLQK